MVDAALPSHQLQQWTLEKTIVRSERSDSSLTTPELFDNEDDSKLRIIPPTRTDGDGLDCVEPLFQDRYLSSEEDLSPMEPDYDDDVLSLHDGGEDHCGAVKVMASTQAAEKKEQGKSSDLAVVVSYINVGRPKVIEVPTAAPKERTFRSTSEGNILQAAERPILRPSRLSISSTPGDSTVKTIQAGPRRPSTAASPSADPKASRTSLSSSQDSVRGSTSTPSKALGLSINTRRPQTFRGSTFPIANPFQQPPKQSQSFRSSLMALSPRTASAPFPPLTPVTPSTPSFLDSDPCANNTSVPKRRRLRSISRTLSLAKIAVLPNGGRKSSTTSISSEPQPQRVPLPKKFMQINRPPTPVTPNTPMSAYASSTTNLLASPKIPQQRRYSQPKMMPRRADERARPSEAPAYKSQPIGGSRSGMEVRERPRMVPRGAADRAPPLELPPFPDEMDMSMSSFGVTIGGGSEKRRIVKKRKSLLGLMQS